MNLYFAFIVGWLSAIAFGLIGAVIYRWRGSASKYKKYFPRPFNQIAFSLPFAYIAYASGGIVASLVVLVLTVLACVTGHGAAHDMGSDEKERDDETLEFTVSWLRGKIPEYWYDVILMSVLGIAITLPCGIATLSPFIALSGALKAPAYMIGHYVYNNSPKVKKLNNSGKRYNGVIYLPRHLDYHTEIGEFLTGFLLWGSLWLLV